VASCCLYDFNELLPPSANVKKELEKYITFFDLGPI